MIRDHVPLLANDAAIVSYGALGGERFGIGGSDLVARQFVNRGVVFTRWFVELSQEEQAGNIQFAFKLAGELPSLEGRPVHALDNCQEALSAVEAPSRDGFVLIRP